MTSITKIYTYKFIEIFKKLPHVFITTITTITATKTATKTEITSTKTKTIITTKEA